MGYRVTLWVDGIKKEYHTFDLPYGCPRWYVSVTSISAFSTREGKKLYENSLKGIMGVDGKRCHVQWGEDVKFSIDTETRLFKKYGIPITDLPTFHHETVWDFYEAIGYDRKKQKYIV